MSMTFTKLFSSITESTIWGEDNETRLVWITMLAMSDKFGRVWGSVPGLARRAVVSLDGCDAALVKLLSPDRRSRTQDHDGRRIRVIDGGWELLNYAKYRAIRDEEAIKESKRRYINDRRVREKAEKQGVTLPVENVDRSRANADADADADADSRKKKETVAVPALFWGHPEFVKAWEDWKQHRKALRKPITPQGARLQLAKCQAWGADRATAIITNAIEKGWQGLYESEQNGTASPRPYVPPKGIEPPKMNLAGLAGPGKQNE